MDVTGYTDDARSRKPNTWRWWVMVQPEDKRGKKPLPHYGWREIEKIGNTRFQNWGSLAESRIMLGTANQESEIMK